MASERTETWDLWYPQAAATGLPFARSRIAGAEALLVHSAPPILTVTVRDSEGRVAASGEDLPATDETPMTRLTRRNGRVEREDIWPGQEDLGRLVILPGGEAGVLMSWYNADDRSEWRWQIELYNHK